MTCEEVRLSLGAHALGALEADEAAEIDTHLATCEACGAELLDLAGVAGFLGKVSERDVELVSSPPRRVLDRLLDDRARRHRRGRRLTAVAAAAAVLVVGGTVWGVTQQGGGATEQAASAPMAETSRESPSLQNEDRAARAESRQAAPSASEGPSLYATKAPKPTPSPRSPKQARDREFAGVREGRGFTVVARPAGDGARLDVQVTGLPEGVEGHIVVHSRKGDRDRVKSWTVPDAGPRFSVRTRFSPAEIARLDVVGVKGEVYVSAVPRN